MIGRQRECVCGEGGGEEREERQCNGKGWGGGGRGAGGNCIARALGLKIFRQGNEAVLKCF